MSAKNILIKYLNFWKSHYAEYPTKFSGKREVILSLYLSACKSQADLTGENNVK